MKKLIALFLLSAIACFAQTYTAKVGQTVTLDVTVTQGTEPLSYQWYKDGVLEPGVTQKSQTTVVTMAEAGKYKASVSNSAGTTMSQEVTLVIVAATTAPVFTLHPAAKSVDLGSAVTFTALASGTPAPTYQWLKNGVVIPGATGTTYSIGVAKTTDVGTYSVRATNATGNAVSNGATLTVTVPVIIPAGAKATITVSP